jgi:hypothetical protein
MLRSILLTALILTLNTADAASTSKKVTLEDLAASIKRIEDRLYRAELGRYRQQQAIRATNICWKQCDSLFPWEQQPEPSTSAYKDWIEERKACGDACPRFPDEVPGGC